MPYFCLQSNPAHDESMRIEKWEAGIELERECPKMTEFLFIEGEAQEGTQAAALPCYYVFRRIAPLNRC